MDPFTIFALILTAASAYSGYVQAEAAKGASEYNASVERNNQILSEAQKKNRQEQGVLQELDRRMATRKLRGSQVAEMAAAGLDLSEGSAAQIIAGTDFMGEVDALRVRDQANMDAWALDNEARQHKSNAEFYARQASSTNPLLSGVMSGASTFASLYSGGAFSGLGGVFTSSKVAAQGLTVKGVSGLSMAL